MSERIINPAQYRTRNVRGNVNGASLPIIQASRLEMSDLIAAATGELTPIKVTTPGGKDRRSGNK